ncbi:MAG: adenylate kinase [Eubacteriales bacterium]|nr:adenylate kinase [Eubacteriales bacterium]
MNIIMLGPPGSGKGTMAALLSKKLAIPQISTGDMLRAGMKEGTELGRMAKGFVDKGELVPDSVVIAMVEERLKAQDAQNGYILDGFPRTLEQAKALEGFTKIDTVLDLELADEKIIDRLSGRRVCPDCSRTYHVSQLNGSTICEKCRTKLVTRKDDEAETIANRLNVYHEQTEPLVEYYKEAKLLKNVKTDGSIEENFSEMLKVLGI